jgi:hypothetical protein
LERRLEARVKAGALCLELNEFGPDDAYHVKISGAHP